MENTSNRFASLALALEEGEDSDEEREGSVPGSASGSTSSSASGSPSSPSSSWPRYQEPTQVCFEKGDTVMEVRLSPQRSWGLTEQVFQELGQKTREKYENLVEILITTTDEAREKLPEGERLHLSTLALVRLCQLFPSLRTVRIASHLVVLGSCEEDRAHAETIRHFFPLECSALSVLEGFPTPGQGPTTLILPGISNVFSYVPLLLLRAAFGLRVLEISEEHCAQEERNLLYFLTHMSTALPQTALFPDTFPPNLEPLEIQFSTMPFNDLMRLSRERVHLHPMAIHRGVDARQFLFMTVRNVFSPQLNDTQEENRWLREQMRQQPPLSGFTLACFIRDLHLRVNTYLPREALKPVPDELSLTVQDMGDLVFRQSSLGNRIHLSGGLRVIPVDTAHRLVGVEIDVRGRDLGWVDRLWESLRADGENLEFVTLRGGWRWTLHTSSLCHSLLAWPKLKRMILDFGELQDDGAETARVIYPQPTTEEGTGPVIALRRLASEEDSCPENSADCSCALSASTVQQLQEVLKLCNAVLVFSNTNKHPFEGVPAAHETVVSSRVDPDSKTIQLRWNRAACEQVFSRSHGELANLARVLAWLATYADEYTLGFHPVVWSLGEASEECPALLQCVQDMTSCPFV